MAFYIKCSKVLACNSPSVIHRAVSFRGRGLSAWNVSQVISMHKMFNMYDSSGTASSPGSILFNADLSQWDGTCGFVLWFGELLAIDLTACNMSAVYISLSRDGYAWHVPRCL